MTDLRRKQRQKREEAIINAAKELISEKGYRNTSIEEIAEKAEVGPATVYNYFTSKSGLLVTILKREVETLSKYEKEVFGKLPDKAEEAVYEFIRIYFIDFISRYNRQLMREIFVAALVEQVPVRKELMGLDYALMAQMVELLEMMKSRGKISPDINSEDVAFIIFSVVITNLMAFIFDDDMPVEDCFQAMKRQINLVSRGFTP